MVRRYYNLVLMGLWLVVAVCLLVPDLVLPDRVRQQFRNPGGVMAGALALVFAVFNLVRWWSYQAVDRARTRRAVNPLAVRKPDLEGEQYEPNPELDFFKRPDGTEASDDRPANGTR
jgi:hypothetical protein